MLHMSLNSGTLLKCQTHLVFSRQASVHGTFWCVRWLIMYATAQKT